MINAFADLFLYGRLPNVLNFSLFRLNTAVYIL